MLIRNNGPHLERDLSGKVVRAGMEVTFGRKGEPSYTVYKFLPQNPKDLESDQVCDVKNPEHIEIFLSLHERYELMPKATDEEKLIETLKPKADARRAAQVAAEAAEQKRLDNAAKERQKRAKENKGKQAQPTVIADLD